MENTCKVPQVFNVENSLEQPAQALLRLNRKILRPVRCPGVFKLQFSISNRSKK